MPRPVLTPPAARPGGSAPPDRAAPDTGAPGDAASERRRQGRDGADATRPAPQPAACGGDSRAAPPAGLSAGGAAVLTLASVMALGLAGVWALGGLEGVTAWAMAGQRTAQNAMAAALRALRAGEAGALVGLLGLAFTYGVLHAVGPGHGKLLIGGYGAATRVRLAPLAAIAALASLGQATVAVALVHGGIAVLDRSRAEVLGLGEGALTTASTAAIGAIGLWLVWRGARGLGRMLGPARRPGGAAAQGTCPDCGHRHGPDPAEVAGLTGWRAAAALIAAIAIRPCSGALFLLILTWRMDIAAAGIAGAYAMALGTGLVTVAVAALAVTARGGALIWAGRLRALAPALELGVGLLVALAAAQALRLGL